MTYDLQCQTKGGGVEDYGVGTLTFLPDGSIELCMVSKSPIWGRTPFTGPGSPADPMRGRVDSSGHVLIERNEVDATRRWEAQFNLTPTADGQRPVGGGKYQSRDTYSDGELLQTCQGTFTLGETGSTP